MCSSVEILRQQLIKFETSVSDAVFVDDDTLLLIDEAVNLWRHSLSSGTTTVLAARSHVVGDYVDQDRMRSRMWPRLAVDPHLGCVVVNTESAVLVAQDREGRWLTMIEGWGLYDPILDFSPTGSVFAMLAETELLVWDALALPDRFSTPPPVDEAGWRSQTHHDAKPTFQLDDVEAFTWTLDGQHLVALRTDGRLQTLDPLSGDVVSQFGVVSYANESAEHLGKLALSFLSENTFAISLEASSLDVWRLEPFEVIARIPVEETADSIAVDSQRSWFAMESEHHLRFWNTETLTEITSIPKPARSWAGIRFSPDRSHMLTIGQPESPQTREPPTTEASVGVTLWRVKPSASPGAG